MCSVSVLAFWVRSLDNGFALGGSRETYQRLQVDAGEIAAVYFKGGSGYSCLLLTCDNHIVRSVESGLIVRDNPNCFEG